MAGRNFVDALGRPTFDSGWIANSDWTNRHLGTGAAKNADADVTHNLNTPLPFLTVNLYWSEDGTDALARQFKDGQDSSAAERGFMIRDGADPLNQVQIQTATAGLSTINANGTVSSLASQDDFYRVIVRKETWEIS